MKKMKEILMWFLKKSQNSSAEKDNKHSFENSNFKKITDEKGSFYVVGNHIIAKARDEKHEKEIEEKLMAEDWDLLIPIIGVIIESILEMKTKANEQKIKVNREDAARILKNKINNSTKIHQS